MRLDAATRCKIEINVPRARCSGRIILVLTLGFLCTIDAHGWSAALLYPTIRQKEEAMSFVAWVVLGLTAGLIGGRLVSRRGESILAEILLGTGGGLAGGWLFYTFGPAGVNGLNLESLYAAVIGSLVVLLTFYAIKRY
jgi:uncharacterized membrane protein YeaQ/YmgE (transglycosylase-associated protein family)